MKPLILYSALYLALFGTTDLLYHRLKVDGEITRKIVHVTTGMIALSFPIFLQSFWQVGVLCGSFLVLLAASERWSWFSSITAVKRKSNGSWLFALAVLLCFWVYQRYGLHYYCLPILVLTIADPAAALVGKRLNFLPVSIFGQHKTIGGALAFLMTTSAILASYNYWCAPIASIAILAALAITATVAELVSGRGWDNLTIPLSVITVLYINQPPMA